jgi:hypothetical protein
MGVESLAEHYGWGVPLGALILNVVMIWVAWKYADRL